MIEDIHPQSKIGTARSKLAALRSRVQPLEERLTAHKAERLQKQTLVERATLDTPPIEVAMAESRIRLLEQAIARETNELAPLVQQLQTAERDLAALEQNAAHKIEWLAEIQNVLSREVHAFGVGRWVSELQATRTALHDLTEAPLPTGARWAPVVDVAFQLLQPGEELPARGSSPRELRQLAWEEEKRRVDQQLVAATSHSGGD